MAELDWDIRVEMEQEDSGDGQTPAIDQKPPETQSQNDEPPQKKGPGRPRKSTSDQDKTDKPVKDDPKTLKAKIKQLESSNTSAAAEISSLKVKLTIKNQKEANLTKDKNQLDAKLNAVTQNKVDLEGEVNLLKQNKTQLEQEKAQLEQEKAQLEQEKAQLETQVGTLRSEAADKEGRINTLQSEVNDKEASKIVMEAKCNTLVDENAKLTDDLATVNRLLAEKIKEKTDLLEHMESDDTGNSSATPKGKEMPKILILADKSKAKLKNFLPNLKCDWSYNGDVDTLQGLSEMLSDEGNLSAIGIYDKVVIFLGTEDIRKGRPATDSVEIIKGLVGTLKDITEVAVVQIPPITNMSTSSPVTVFNWKLSKMKATYEEVEIILNEKVEKKVSSEVVESDGFTLTDEGARLYGQVLADQITVPTMKKNATLQPKVKTELATPDTPCVPDDNVTEFVKVDSDKIRYIYGGGGHNIKAATVDFSVSMNCGAWHETWQSEEFQTSGVFIRGKRSNIDKTKSRVQKLITDKVFRKESTSENKPPKKEPSLKKKENNENKPSTRKFKW